MRRQICLFISLLSLTPACFAARDYQELRKLRAEGAGLSSQQAQDLEKRVGQKPKDEESRIKLLSYYANHPPGTDEEKAARVKHILWVIDHDPKEGWGLMGAGPGMTLGVLCAGPQADPPGYKSVADAWYGAASKMPSEKLVRVQAVAVSEYCEPERAERLLRDTDDQTGLGRLYAHAVLGITGASSPTTTAERREGSFATKARQTLEEGRERDLIVSAAVELLNEGARLWAKGQLDWDYTPLGKTLYGRAIQMDPDDFGLAIAPLKLPQPGEEPQLPLRVGGNVMVQNLVRKVTPAYPAAAKNAGISGTVRMSALIGLDGAVLRLKVQQGPPELVPAALDSVRQWSYKPTLLNGKPVYIITLIDVNFTLQ